MTSSDSSRGALLERLAEEFVERHRRGERPALSEYADRHPDLATDIRDLFPALVRIEHLKPVVGDLTGAFVPASGPADGHTPERLGEYRILREVGHGGMGVVYEAEQESLGRHVALKVLPRQALLNPTYLERFRREAKAAARLHHTNIVPVFGVGECAGTYYYAMQFIPGEGLDKVLGDLRRLRAAPGAPTAAALPSEGSVAHSLLTGRFAAPAATPAAEPPGQPAPPAPTAAGGSHGSSTLSAGGPEADYFRGIARVAVQVADALAYAHRQGILHRDIKPSNLLLDQQGTVWVTDFGLAKAEGADDLTHTGDIVGTIRFMAPERFDGRSLPQSDVYSLGLTLYEMLTLHPAFHDTNRARLIEKVLHEPPVPPRKLDPHIPRDLETIVLKCLAKDAAGRYATAEELAEDLRRFLADQTIRARRAGWVERLRRWCRRNPALAAVGGLAASLLVVTTAVSIGWAIHSSWLAEDIRRAWRESENIQHAWSESESALAAHKAQILYERGEIGQGLLWTARSLETAPEGTEDFCEDLRAILAGWRSRLFPLTGCHAVADEILAFSPEGSIVWAAEPGGSVYRRVITTGERIGQPLSPESKVIAVAASPAGDFILTAEDRVACLWEVATGKPVRTFRPSGWLTAVALSADGRIVLTADHVPTNRGYDTTIRCWEARTGQQRTPTYHYEGSVSALALSPDGRTLLAATKGGEEAICSWDVATGKSLPPLPLPRGRYLTLAFSPDGLSLLTGSRDQTAHLWNVATGRPLGPPLSHSTSVRLVAFSRDGRTLLTADDRRTVRTWAVELGPSPTQIFVHHMEVRTVAVSPDGQTVATGCFDKFVRIWNTRRGAEAKVLPHEAPLSTILFSPDGRTLLTADWKGVARLWHADSGQPKGEPLRHGKHVHALAFSGSSQLVATGSYDGTARIWDAATGASRATVRHGDAVVAVTFDPSETRLLTGSTDGTAWIWDIATGQPLGDPLKHGGTVRAVAFSREGNRVLTASMDGTARLWDAATGQLLSPPMVHRGTVWVAAFSPDGRRILTGSWDGTAQLWDAATGQPRGQPLAHVDQVRAAAFSPDSRWVVTGSLDGTARLWDAATGRPLGPRLPHPGRVWAVAFGATGRMVLTGCADGRARLWQMPPPLEGRLERVVLWAQVRTGMELAADGEVRVLDPPVWKQRQSRLEELGGPPAP
jgi:WD40 repeat protein/serine/threonine protein kinase